MGQRNEKKIKRMRCLFIDDFKIYQKCHQKLEVVNEIIFKSSMNTGACYGIKKCTENVFRKGTIKGEGLAFWK